MAIAIKHKKVLSVPDDGDDNHVGSNEWNDDHNIEMATSKILGRKTAGTGPVEELTLDDLLETASRIFLSPALKATYDAAVVLANAAAPLNSPALTGTPTTPTAAPGTNTTQIASTAFVKAANDALLATILGDAPPAALDTLNELAEALADDANFAATVTTALATKATKTPQFLTLAASGDLDNERVLTAGDGIELSDAGAGGALTVKANPSGLSVKAAPNRFADHTVISDAADSGKAKKALPWQLAGLVQRAYAEYTTHGSTATVIPLDDTIPGIAEGVQILSAAITPKAAGNRLFCITCLNVSGNSASMNFIASLCASDAAQAVAAWVTTLPIANETRILVLVHEVAAANTSQVTFTVRIGSGNVAHTAYLNGNSSTRVFGGVAKCTLNVMEFLP